MDTAISRHSRTYFALLEQLPLEGCAVCRMVDAAAAHYIDIFIHESITNEARREEIRMARGFCSFHTSMFSGSHGRVLSLSVLEQDVLNDVLREINYVMRNPLKKPGLLGSLFSTVARDISAAILARRPCTMCDYEKSMEQVMLGTLLQFIEDPDMTAAFAKSTGLCLPHYYAALKLRNVTRLSTKIERIIPHQHEVMQTLKTEIDGYVRKRNPAYADERMTEGEASSPQRAAKLISGRIEHTDGRW
jgi:hypothetical protein